VKHVDEFRDPALAGRLIERIRRAATRRWTVMEVCGGQTHSLLRHGLVQELERELELLHGPGCPVCVTPVESIDFACDLARRPGMIVASFGDMLRVPGSTESLLTARGAGGDVRVVYSPVDAVDMARRHPDREVTFFAVGFETTLPTTALAVLQAAELELANFSLLSAHVRVLPAMEAILEAPDNRVQAFLAAGHVCTVAGFADYHDLARRRGVPIVVAGFEPIDLLQALLDCVEQLEAGRAEVANRYPRSVREAGNRTAQELVDRVYRAADRPWRGLGVVPAGGYALRPEWRRFDAELRYPRAVRAMPVDGDSECRAGEVLCGRLRPSDCPSFGVRCTPTSPLGAPMVSSEGACAAYYRYHGSTSLKLSTCPIPE